MKTSALVIAAAVLIPVAAQAASPFDGTWKTDMNQLHLSKKPYVYVIDSTTYACTSCVPSYSVKADGTDQKITGHDFDTIAVTLGTNSVSIVTKLKGKKLGETQDTVSADGKTDNAEGTYYYGAEPVKVKMLETRVAAGAAGSHPLSGSWVDTKVISASDSAMTETLGMTDDGFTMSANGQSYDAKFDGKKYAISGDPTNTMVKLKKVSATQVVESDYDKGKLVETVQMTVAGDGKTLKIVDSRLREGRVSHYTLDKQP